MKKILALLLSAVTLFTLISCNSKLNDSDPDTDTVASEAQNEAEKEENIVVPPTRVSANPSKAMYVGGCTTMEELYEESDVIAYIRIKNWLGDATQEEYLGVTCFEAEVLEVYKGDIEDEFVLVQMGTPARTCKDYPLHTYGQEMFVFLYDIQDYLSGLETYHPPFEYENSYQTVGGPLNIWYTAEVDGEMYIAPKFDSAIKDDMISMTAQACDSTVSSRVAYSLMAADAIDNPGNSLDFVIKLDDMIEFIKTYEEQLHGVRKAVKERKYVI